MKLAEHRLVSFLLIGVAFSLVLACQPPFLSNQTGVAACVQENIALLEPGWQVAWLAEIEDGYIQFPLFVTNDYLVVVDGIAAASCRNRIRAYYLHSGEEAWSIAVANIGSPGQTFHVTDRYIVTQVQDSTSVLYTDSGETALRFGNSGFPDPTSVFTLALDDENECLYVHDFLGNFRAHRLPIGELVWERQMPEAMRASNLFVTQDQLVVSLLTGLWILDAENGQILTQFPVDKLANARLYEDEFMVGAQLNSLCTVSIDSGETVWEKRYHPFILYEPPAYSEGILYFPGGERGLEGAHQIMAVALATGELLWNYQAEDGVGAISGVAVSNGTGYAVFSDGTLRAFDLKTGQMKVILQSDALYYWATDDAKPIFRTLQTE